MRDPATEADLLRSLSDAYNEIVEGRALGQAGSGDYNPKGAAMRVSSGSGMTATPAAGLGKDKAIKNNPKADDKRAKRQSDQAKADRKAAALDRRKEGDDKVQRKINDIQNFPGKYGLKGADKDGDGKIKIKDA